MAQSDKWILDATISGESALVFCPVELDASGEIVSIITGMNFIGDCPPHGELVAIVHEDGQQAVEQWCSAHPQELARLREWCSARRSPNRLGEE